MRSYHGLIFAFFLVLFPLNASAQWPSNGSPLCTATGEQELPQVASDGVGGAYVVWRDNRGGYYDIYIQRVDAAGNAQWTSGGVALCNASYDQLEPQIVEDDAGGAIVAWHDGRSITSYDMYAQRINSSGTPQWTANGVLVSGAASHQHFPVMVKDGSGGAVIAWLDHRNAATEPDVYAQRINSSGTVQWTTDGVLMLSPTQGQTTVNICADGGGGAIVVWGDTRNGNWDVWAQRVNGSGSVVWTSNGVGVCTESHDQPGAFVVADGSGGAIVGWSDARPGTYDIYVQRLNSSGTAQWTTNGIAICNASQSQYGPQFVSDGSGGALLSWVDYRNGSADIYAQRINGSGAAQWTANGVAVSTAANSQSRLSMTTDAAGGAIMVWDDDRANPGYENIYTQRINSSGVVQWTTNGVALCTASDFQRWATITWDGANGAIVAWHDFRSGAARDIYAGRVLSDGTVATGATISSFDAYTDSTTAAGDHFKYQYKVRASWTTDIAAKSRLQYRVQGVSTWSQSTESASASTSHIRVVGGLTDGTTYEVRAVSNVSGVLTYSSIETVSTYNADVVVSGLTMQMGAAPPNGAFAYFDFTTSANTSCKINIRKEQTPALAWGSDEFTSSTLHGNSHSHMITGLTFNTAYHAYIQVFGSASFGGEDTVFPDGAVPGSTATTVYIRFVTPTKEGEGGGYEFEQQTSPLNPRAEGTETYLVGNYPNPFNPSTTIEFAVEKEMAVSLKVFDISGKRVRSLAEESFPAGKHRLAWDGRDENGSPVATGVYFVKMQAGAKIYTRKMILLK